MTVDQGRSHANGKMNQMDHHGSAHQQQQQHSSQQQQQPPAGVHYLPPEAAGLFPSLGHQAQLHASHDGPSHQHPQHFMSHQQHAHLQQSSTATTSSASSGSSSPFPSQQQQQQQQPASQQPHMRAYSQHGAFPDPAGQVGTAPGQIGNAPTSAPNAAFARAQYHQQAAYPMPPQHVGHTPLPVPIQGFPFASGAAETQPNLLPPLMPQEGEPRTFSMVIRQHPLQGRMCGFGSKDRRPLDPVPIVQARIFTADGQRDIEAEGSPHLMMQVSLLFDRTQQEATMIKNSSDFHYPWRRALEGKLIASGHVVRDVDGERACFFVFPDLSVRLEGVYRLRFNLMRIGPNPNGAAGAVVATLDSDAFTVYSPREFPGMLESSELAKTLARAGVLIATRSKGRDAGHE